jgi:hypothetical protein
MRWVTYEGRKLGAELCSGSYGEHARDATKPAASALDDSLDCKAPFAAPKQVLRYLSGYHPSRCHLEPPPHCSRAKTSMTIMQYVGRISKSSGESSFGSGVYPSARDRSYLLPVRARSGQSVMRRSSARNVLFVSFVAVSCRSGVVPLRNCR